MAKLLMDTATIDVPQHDAKGNVIGSKEEPAIFYELMSGFYDSHGKGWWKRFGMVSMHDEVISRLTNSEVRSCRMLKIPATDLSTVLLEGAS